MRILNQIDKQRRAGIMNEQPSGNDNDQETDVADNEVGPTEKLRESSAGDLSVPGAQNPDSEEIKDEKGQNTE
jgi:hypothetical protein